jgi:hypothetical protein
MKSFIGWMAIIFMLVFSVFVLWDNIHTRLTTLERAVLELKETERPLIIVDKFSRVFVGGIDVTPEEGK